MICDGIVGAKIVNFIKNSEMSNLSSVKMSKPADGHAQFINFNSISVGIVSVSDFTSNSVVIESL